MDLETILMWVRFCIHVATFLFIYCYRPQGARQRWGVSLLAVCLAGSSIGFAVFILFGVIDPTFAIWPQWLHILGWGSVLGLLIKSRGNVAKMMRPRHERSIQ